MLSKVRSTVGKLRNILVSCAPQESQTCHLHQIASARGKVIEESAAALWHRKTPRQLLGHDFISVGRTERVVHCTIKRQIEFGAPKHGLTSYKFQNVCAATTFETFRGLGEYLVQRPKCFIDFVVHLAFPLKHRGDIRMCKILALEQQRLARLFCKSVGKAVAEI
jgi:hypothetical protein